MRTYLIYDRETGDALNTVVAAGPLQLSDDLIEHLVATGGLERAAFVEVDPSRLPLNPSHLPRGTGMGVADVRGHAQAYGGAGTR